MYYFYPEWEMKKGGSAVPIDEMDANVYWAQHRYNYAILKHIMSQTEKLSYNERAQATKELSIAERKMSFWEKHPLFNMTVAKKEVKQQFGMTI